MLPLGEGGRFPSCTPVICELNTLASPSVSPIMTEKRDVRRGTDRERDENTKSFLLL